MPSRIDVAFEVNPEVSDGEVARVRQVGYTEREAAETVANVAPVWRSFPQIPDDRKP
jgi:hypothetical protein